MAETPGGHVGLTVHEVSDDNILVDGNRPPAGRRLHLDKYRPPALASNEWFHKPHILHLDGLVPLPAWRNATNESGAV
jgi:hypothetical protein